MAFDIELAARAELDISEEVDYIRQDSAARALKWFEDLFALVETLRELPECHPLIPESKDLKRSLRSVHHHSHRVIYEVQPSRNIVYIVRVYHGFRKPLTGKDI